jgi:hypothetical protein
MENIETFGSLAEARRRRLELDPQGPPLQEAVKCTSRGDLVSRPPARSYDRTPQIAAVL